jgi:hypothetical protein
MKYATNMACDQAGPKLRAIEPTHLDALPLMAERAELLADRLQRFIDRFNGPQGCAGGDSPAPPACLRTQIDRISYAIHRAEEATNELDRIG